MIPYFYSGAILNHNYEQIGFFDGSIEVYPPKTAEESLFVMENIKQAVTREMKANGQWRADYKVNLLAFNPVNPA